MASESMLDQGVREELVAGAAGAANSRNRGWDELSKVVLSSQVNYLNSPTVLTAQGIRMLNGTPGEFANSVPAAK